MGVRMAKVNEERVKEGLKASGLSQRKLAEMIGVDYKYMNMCIKRGEIGSWTLNEIGKAINRAPEYLSGGKDGGIADGIVLTYSFHENQEKSMQQRMEETIDGLIYFSFIDRKDEMKAFSGEQKREMMFRAVHAADAYYMEVVMGKED